jgi:hypothetical protein
VLEGAEEIRRERVPVVSVSTRCIAIDGVPNGFVFKPMSLETLLLVLSLVALGRRRAR